MTRLTKGLLTGMATLLVLAGVLGVYASHQEEMAGIYQRQAEGFRQEAEESRNRAVEAESWAVGYKERADEARTKADALEGQLAKLKVPAPRPAPVTDPEMATGLAQEGLQTGLEVQDVPASTLARKDAVTVWEWRQQALAVPMLRSSLDVTGQALQLRTQEATGLRSALAFTEQSSAAWKESSADQQRRAESLDREVKALQKSATAQKWQKWAMVAGGVLGGVLAGRAIR